MLRYVFLGFGKCFEKTSEAYLEPSQASKMELFVKIVNGFEPLAIFAKSPILDVLLGSETAFDFEPKPFLLS